jgi:hypothetical protein
MKFSNSITPDDCFGRYQCSANTMTEEPPSSGFDQSSTQALRGLVFRDVASIRIGGTTARRSRRASESRCEPAHTAADQGGDCADAWPSLSSEDYHWVARSPSANEAAMMMLAWGGASGDDRGPALLAVRDRELAEADSWEEVAPDEDAFSGGAPAASGVGASWDILDDDDDDDSRESSEDPLADAERPTPGCERDPAAMAAASTASTTASLSALPPADEAGSVSPRGIGIDLLALDPKAAGERALRRTSRAKARMARRAAAAAAAAHAGDGAAAAELLAKASASSHSSEDDGESDEGDDHVQPSRESERGSARRMRARSAASGARAAAPPPRSPSLAVATAAAATREGRQTTKPPQQPSQRGDRGGVHATPSLRRAPCGVFQGDEKLALGLGRRAALRKQPLRCSSTPVVLPLSFAALLMNRSVSRGLTNRGVWGVKR